MSVALQKNARDLPMETMMNRMHRSMTGLIAFILAASFFSPSAFAIKFAIKEEADPLVTPEQCRDQLLSGDFTIVDGKDQKPLLHVARQLAQAIQDLIDRKGSKDEPKAQERFDRAHDDVMRRILDGRWGIDETSENILDDCYYSLHPEADPTD
jgi:hypothetical protein